MSWRGGIPPRWKNCPRFGDVVANIFFPFKVPLDETYNSHVPPSSLFTPDMLINFAKQNKINLGLWIDLTYTDRFYNRNLIESHGISYVKLKCRGHGECPSMDQTALFMEICAKFLERNPNKIIGVHCTHGFNRTGFLICAYLVDQESWCLEAALSAFARARQPGIYKQDYLDELFKRYGDGDPNTRVHAPQLPDWCNEDDEFNDDQVVHHQSDQSIINGDSQTPGQRKLLEGIDNILLVTDQEKILTLQQTCSEMCKFNKSGFPGCQPVSLTHQNIHFIQEDYMVSWKADGNRYLMLILGPNQMYFFDRDYQVFQVFNLTFLKRNLNEPLTNTLLDGEMVIDVVDGKRWPRFLIYDIVFCDGQDVSEKNFRDRFNTIFKDIIRPRETAKRNGQIDRNKEPIGIRIKDFCDLKLTYKYFEPKFQNVLSHEIDGLIFQPVNLAYLAGRCDKVLKWKPPSHNSVDFQLKIIEETRPGMLEKYIGQLFVGGKREPFSYIKVTNELKKHNGKIIECRFNHQKNGWEFMRVRTDKSYPNGLNTANNVVYSIRYPITREYLLEYIQKQGFRS